MLNTPKDLIVQGRKVVRPNSFLLDVFIFTASFIILFIFSYLFALSFLTLFIIFYNLNVPPNLSFSVIDVFYMIIRENKGFYCRIMFKEGIGLLICWLMKRLSISSNREVDYMLMHIIG